MTTLDSLATALEAGDMTSRALTEGCLAQTEIGEGPRAFIFVDRDGALAAAEAADVQRRAGVHPSRYAGIPISVKDLFDMRGQVTGAGSKVLAGAPPAKTDAPAIANLRRAGFVIIGRTNMTEFAYSGLGMNPHYGTPANPWDRENTRIPGGSSSGAAISVTDGMAFAGIGTDTGGSCRIPAALCGIVGYKPTQSNVSLDQVSPLSSTLDSVGSLGKNPRCVEILDAIMGGATPRPMCSLPPRGLRFLAPTNFVLDGLDDKVASDFEEALTSMRSKGILIDESPISALDRLPEINGKGGFAAAEASHRHQALMARIPELYDPRVIERIRKGESQSASDYLTLLQERVRFIADVNTTLSAYDAILMPTVPTIAPKITDLDRDEQLYGNTNLAMLRNPSVINFLDGCSISVPMHAPESAPTGLMISGAGGNDAKVFGITHSIAAMSLPL